MELKRKRILAYAIYGFLLGLLFPIAATAIELNNMGLEASWVIIRAIHFGHPPMLIIDATPVILSASFALIGIQSARVHEKSNQLDEQIISQTSKVENEHYFLEALIASTSFAIVRLDINHHVVTCNQAFEELFGFTCDEIIGKRIDDLISVDDLYIEASQITENVSSGELVRKISQRKRKNGTLVDVEIVGVPVTVGGEIIGALGLYHDISERRAIAQALQESEARFRSLFDESPTSLWEEDFSDVKQILTKIGDKEQMIELLNQDYDLVSDCAKAVKILDVNQATIDLYNANSKAELIQSLPRVLVIESMEEFRQELLALINGETSFECEIQQKKLSGELIYGMLRLSLPLGYEDTWERVHISITDITERREAEEELRYISFHDALTGLYNRAYFEEEMERLSGSRLYPVSIIACDLDNLKPINDQLGHDTGDRAIKAAAKILGLHTFRKEDVVARIGGDEFIVLLPSIDLDQNTEILERLDNEIEQFNISDADDGLYRPISLSFGHSVVREGGSLVDCYKAADQAMYNNKEKKKSNK